MRGTRERERIVQHRRLTGWAFLAVVVKSGEGAGGRGGEDSLLAVLTVAVTCRLQGSVPACKSLCEKCGKKCTGEVLRVSEKYFHIDCFKCKACSVSLAHGGFFQKDNDFYCSSDYQKRYGTKCGGCGEYVEGEVVSALGNTYHQRCFKCARCRQPFPTGERVTFTGKECLCQKCLQIPVVDSQSPTHSPGTGLPRCAGCADELKEGQALIAMDKQWHVWCFQCATCSAMLHGEYMGKDGKPYCEKDYQKLFGIRCAYCQRFISGKVLQAGENRHFHPTCARCTKCGDPFGDGEEMYLQGAAIWHPKCGPGPGAELINPRHPNDQNSIPNGHLQDEYYSGGELDGVDGMSSISDTQYMDGRMFSPGFVLRDYNNKSPSHVKKIFTYSYLTAEPSLGYLKKPIHPYDRAQPKSPHFHRPSGGSKSPRVPSRNSERRSGMKSLIYHMEAISPRPRSPHMNNEEPIELSQFPAARPPTPGETPKIERDDFPAPPFPYTDRERVRRWSGSAKNALDDDDEEANEVLSGDGTGLKENVDPRIKKTEEELLKASNGMGKVFLDQVREREKIRLWKLKHLDPRKASRTPSADREPSYSLRFPSSVDAFVSALRHVPKPGYGLAKNPYRYYTRCSASPHRPRTAMSTSALVNDYVDGRGMGEKTHSTDLSSAKSDVSTISLHGGNGKREMAREIVTSETFTPGMRAAAGSSGMAAHLRQSLPNMKVPLPGSGEPPKIYAMHLLMTTNYRLPGDVDRANLERHLSEAEFERIFHMSRADFYRLPQWRRNDLKKRNQLF
ncbi:unnamed protein product [Notodromas monacha]|uniref:Actin-binding LIM protein 1 n=1 Tax=Notodromas monacha TaxID=399045 RepID=A0A7R9BJ90_9CRUS|nr:unnamed protein product [Notodromas monacha]CAG0915423.1 unnamed protein product [Notodromas monacha]